MARPHIRLALLNIPPFLIVNEEEDTFTLDGPFEYVLPILTRVINASIELVHGGDDYGLELAPGNWSGVIGMVVNQEVDAMLSPAVVMPELDEYVGFSTSFRTNKYAILSGIPLNYAQISSSIFSSLDHQLLICFFVSWLLISTLYHLFKVEPKFNEKNDDYKSSFVQNLLSFYGVLLKIGFHTLPMYTGRRILLTSWLLSTFVLMTMVAGSMYSRLAITDVPERIDSLEDVIKHPKIRTFMPKGLILETRFKTSIIPTEVEIWKQVLRHNGLVEIADMFDPDVIDDVYKGKTVLLANDDFLIPILVGITCTTERRPFYVSKNSILSLSTAFIYRKGLDSAIVEDINAAGLLIGGSGLMDKSQLIVSRRAIPCLDQAYSRTHEASLGLKELGQAFVILGIGLASSLIVFFVEICFS